MYNDKLEALISAALADGVLTEKEKQVLFKKAEAMGIDLDEFEIELEARRVKRREEKEQELRERRAARATQQPVQSAPPKQKASLHDLDELIQEYLADGFISAKERQALLQKARRLGLDCNEADLYIDAQQQKADNAIDAAKKKRKGKTCPYCDGDIPELTEVCPHCGKRITPEASSELEEIFNQLEDALVNFKSGDEDNISRSKAEVERYIRKAKMYYSTNPKVQHMLDEIAAESAAADEEMKKNARNKFLANFVGKYKWFIIGAVVVVFGVGYYLYHSSKPEYSATKTSSLVMEAVKDGDFDKADALIDAYLSHKGQFYNDISGAGAALNDAKVKKALDEGNYDEAFAGLATNGLETMADRASAYYDRICMCLDDMKKKGISVSDMQKFIDRETEVYSEHAIPEEWSKSNVKKRLYDYIK